jgi:hypothetical protein
MWSDNEADSDLLGFQHLQSSVCSIVKTEHLLPATIGVFGDWGSGKSSLLRMVAAELTKDPSVLVLSFNGWLFEGYDDAKAALMGTIIDEIVDRRTLTAEVTEAAKNTVVKLIKKIQWLRIAGVVGRAGIGFVAGGPVGAGASLVADGAKFASEMMTRADETLKGAENLSVEDLEKELASDPGRALRKGVRELRADFETLLKETKIKTLVVLIDDLDRCMPDTIIETLEAIKLFLFVPRTAFILGADERLVKYAVRRRFPELPGERAEVGRDYLEKLIQFPIRVPPLGRGEIESYINLLFTRKANLAPKKFEAARQCVLTCETDNLLGVRFNKDMALKVLGELPKELDDDLSLAQRIGPMLATILSGNPRQCKRFLNTLVMRSEMAKSRGVELKKRVLAKLMLLEYFKTESFKKLAESQAEHGGKPKDLAAAEDLLCGEAENTSNSEEETKEDGKRAGRKPARKPPRTDESELPSWLLDNWVREWVKSEPALSAENLGPYFYFSRDNLGSLGGAIHRMSPRAQEILAEVTHKSDAIRKNALQKSKNLGPSDAAAVFDALTERVRQDESLAAENSTLFQLMDFVGERGELFSQLMIFMESIRHEELPISCFPRIRLMAPDGANKVSAQALFQKWQESPISRIKTAATNALKNY